MRAFRAPHSSVRRPYDHRVPLPSHDDLLAALATVLDPEIRKPITDLNMVASAEVGPDGQARVSVLLTIAGCPMKEQLTRDVTAALARLDGVTGVQVSLGVMSDAQRGALRQQLRG